MPKKVLVAYYTQTGQIRDILHSIMEPVAAYEDIEITYEELKPKPPFPFPWTSDEFFQVMPECVKGIPCELEPLSLKGDESFDLIVVGYQPWFLSPSIPIHAFFQNEVANKLISGKPVITVIGSRNMWINAQNKIAEYINALNGKLAGNIVLYDKAANLLSIISIIRWMFKGEKGRYLKIIPPSGVSAEDISNAQKFGTCIAKALMEQRIEKAGLSLIELGAVPIETQLIMLEKRGILFFRLWADFILKKGSFGDRKRLFRVNLFKYYLLAVLYLVSPFASILYALIRPFRTKHIKKQISLYQLKTSGMNVFFTFAVLFGYYTL